jgi:hypothetical protein
LWSATCPASGSGLSPTSCQHPACPAICLLIVHLEISSLPSPPSLAHFQHSHPLCCVLVFSSLFLFRCFFGGGSVCPGDYTGLSQGWMGEYRKTLGAHLFGLSNVSQAGLEPAVVVALVAVHLFSQCNVAWRSFLWARGSACLNFDSPWCFINTKYGSSVSARFWSHRAHTFWFCTLVAFLDLPRDSLLLLHSHCSLYICLGCLYLLVQLR